MSKPVEQLAANYLCVIKHPDGSLEEMPEEHCIPHIGCLICDEDKNCEMNLISECDGTIGYSPNDHERILSWGRRNCEK